MGSCRSIGEQPGSRRGKHHLSQCDLGDLMICLRAMPRDWKFPLVCLFPLVFIFTVITGHRAHADSADDWARMKGIVPKGYVCCRADNPPRIDGHLDDGAWQLAPWTDDFVNIEGDRRPAPRFRTRVKMLWDAEYFYLVAEMEEPHVWGTLTKHDTVIFNDNDFEFFIDPDCDLDAFMEHYWKSDELTFSSGGKTARGWQTTKENYQKRYPTRERMGQLSFDAIEVTSLGETAALVLGRWNLQRDPAPVGGNFSLVFRRVDGNWVIIHDHTSLAKEAAAKAYNRNQVAREWEQLLAELHQADPNGYAHLVKIYADKGHWLDRQDAAAIPWMAQYKRNPYPTRIVWKQDDVKNSRLYWLAVSTEGIGDRALVTAERNGQQVDVRASGVERLTIRVNDTMFDLDQPLAVNVQGQPSISAKPGRTITVIEKTLEEHGDPRSVFAGELTIEIPKETAGPADK